MRSIPLNLQTLYAGLLRGLNSPDAEQGSISTRIIKGRPYLYLTTKDGALLLQRSLGPAENEATQEAARAIRMQHPRQNIAAPRSDILIETDGDRLQDELDGARERGPRWKKGINTSLKELRRDTRQGYPPVPLAVP